MHELNKRLRVTLHRVVSIGDEWLLQQACDYAGSTLENSDEKTAARTFPAKNATVGLAFRTRSIIRSEFEVDPQVLKNTMQTLNLNDASRNMSDSVRFVCAIPLLFAEGVNSRGVCGVLYIDSSSEKFFLNDQHLVYLCSLAESFLRSLSKLSIKPVDRIINYGFRFSGLDEEGRVFPRAEDLIAYPGLSYVSNVSAPCIDIAEIQGSEFLLNFEHVDFLPVEN